MNTIVNFISRGVYSVATPFHPFGGAVDIIVVEQKDRSYRSTPWYVRFGKFQGVLKGAEKMVRISVNGVEAGFHMYLDNSGEAYFIREVALEKDDDISEVWISDSLKALVEDVDNGNEQNGDDSVGVCGDESNVSGAEEVQFSDDHVLVDTDRVESGELDDERRFYGFADQQLSDSIGSANYKAYYEDLDNLADVVGSQGSESEVVLFSVDGQVIMAPISSEEGNTDDIQLFTPQFHLGPCDGADFNEDSEGFGSDQETLTADSGNMDVPAPINASENCSNADEKLSNNLAVDVEVVNQVQEAHDIQCTEKCVVDHNKFSDAIDCKNTEGVFRSSSELSLERHVEDVNSHDIGSPCTKLGVRENGGVSQENSPSSIPSFYNPDSPSTPPLLTAEVDASDSNALTIDNSACAGSDSVSLHSVINDPEWKDELTAEMQGIEPVEPQIGSSKEGIKPTVGLGFEISLCGNLLHTGMGSRAADEAFEAYRISADVFKLSASSIIKEENLIARFKGKYFLWDKAAPLVLGMAAFGLDLLSDTNDAILVDDEPPKVSGGTPEITSTSGSRWRLWPLAFRRVKTVQRTTSNLSNEDVFVDSVSGADNQHTELASSPIACNESPRKKLTRTNIPTTQQIASLNLKDGQNIITFSFSSRVLGTQKVDAHIYLWKWNARIVISDVDGTITKSDVLGQVMPLVGKDWTQTGVARLFSAIKENGYQLLFLSARAIVQAYLTRSFLLNIKQDGNTLPNGPVVISPDGLFPSLYREVIRRAPHEFKIACLEDIKALFPSDYNPFYAGFGNRHTDDLCYTKIGIPKGKIFIINPKGEVNINHRIGVKSYTSLHTLVDDMFPPTSMTEQLQEEYNSWNYWRTPLPNIDI